MLKTLVLISGWIEVLFGAAAMGPQAIMIIGLVCVMFTAQPLESLMTFFMNGLRMCDRQKIGPARVARTAMSTYLLVLVVAIPVVLWAANPPCGRYSILPIRPRGMRARSSVPLWGEFITMPSRSTVVWAADPPLADMKCTDPVPP